MGGLITETKPNGKSITIETRSVDPRGKGQTITELAFDTVNVLARADGVTTKALDTALPIPSGVAEKLGDFAAGSYMVAASIVRSPSDVGPAELRRG